MKVDDELVRNMARLSKLEFHEEAFEKIKADLNKMVDFVEQLNELNTDNIEPLIFMSDEVNHLRKDEIQQDITQKDALKNAPQHDSDYFKVPKVLSNPDK